MIKGKRTKEKESNGYVVKKHSISSELHRKMVNAAVAKPENWRH